MVKMAAEPTSVEKSKQVKPSQKLQQVLQKIEDDKKPQILSKSPKVVQKRNPPINADGSNLEEEKQLEMIPESNQPRVVLEESPSLSAVATNAAPTHTTFQARSGHTIPSTKTNSIIGTHVSVRRGMINSKYIDNNVHASIERIKGFERHKRQVNLIMNGKRR